MHTRALICAGLLCCLLGPTARAARWEPAPGTSFKAETKGSPAGTMAGRWVVDGMSARLVFAGAQAIGDRTHMRASWTTRFGPKTRSARVTVECNRFSASMKDKANKWSVEMLITPKAGYGRGAFAYRSRLRTREIGSGEGMSVSAHSFRPQRWRYRVVVEADLVTQSELSGACTMEAR
jgi:hypothetical protein